MALTLTGCSHRGPNLVCRISVPPEAGVKRISVGGSFARAALGGLVRAAREVKDKGTFTFAADATSHAEASSYMVNLKR